MLTIVRIFRRILPLILLFIMVNMAGQEQKKHKHLLGAGFLSALELNHYVVTENQVERENAMIFTVVGIYSATKYLVHGSELCLKTLRKFTQIE